MTRSVLDFMTLSMGGKFVWNMGLMQLNVMFALKSFTRRYGTTGRYGTTELCGDHTG